MRNAEGLLYNIEGKTINKSDVSYSIDRVWNELRLARNMFSEETSYKYKHVKILDDLEKLAEKDIDRAEKLMKATSSEQQKLKCTYRIEAWLAMKNMTTIYRKEIK